MPIVLEGAGREGAGSPDGAGAEVTVLFFAAAREATGEPRASPDGAAGKTVSELVSWMRSEYGAPLASLLDSCAIWVNGEPSQPGQVLRPRDEVAVLPPVSGG